MTLYKLVAMQKIHGLRNVELIRPPIRATFPEHESAVDHMGSVGI